MTRMFVMAVILHQLSATPSHDGSNRHLTRTARLGGLDHGFADSWCAGFRLHYCHRAARLLARGPGEASRVLEDNVKFKAIAVIATTTALSLGMAVSAAASPLSHTSKHAPQVTGVRLQSALLPVSAFGDGFTVVNRLNTGNKLWPTHVHIRPSNLSCADFENYVVVGGYGNTAGAADSVFSRNPAFADYPSVILGYDQTVLQFGSAQAAASFYNQAYTRYKQCSHFTESDPADHSIKFELNTQSLSKTTIAKNKAFQVIQLVDLSSLPVLSFYASTAVVLVGTNVYTIDNIDGTNDPISTPLLAKLINRVQALYQHH